MENNDKVVYMETNQKEEKIKRQAKVVGDIAMDSVTKTLNDQQTLIYSAWAGLYHGLKYKGSIGRGVKAAAATFGVFAGVRFIKDVFNDKDKIKKA